MRFDSIQARERFVADSLKRARDTTARAGAKRDTIVNQNAARLPRPPMTRDTGAARLDTARIHELLRQRPVPTDRWVVRTARVLKPGAKYLVRVRAANLNVATANGEAVLAVPVPKEPPAKKDSTHAAPPPAAPAKPR
jgi:hypothetical protein